MYICTNVCVSLLDCVYVFVREKENKRRPREAVNSHEQAASAAVAEVTGTIGASSKHEATWWSQCCPTGAKYRFGVVPSTLPLSHVGVKAVQGAWTGGGGGVRAGVVVLLCWAVLCCVVECVCVCCSLLCRLLCDLFFCFALPLPLSFLGRFVCATFLPWRCCSRSCCSSSYCCCCWLTSNTHRQRHTCTQAWQGGVFYFVVLSLTDNAILRCTFSPQRTLGLVRCECFNWIQ